MELERVNELDSRQKLLDEEGRQIKIKQDKLVQDQLRFNKDLQDLAQEKEFVAIALKKTQEQELVEKRLDLKKIEAKKQEEDIILATTRLEEQQKLTNTQIEKLASLSKKEEEIKQKEVLLLKTDQVQNKRQEALEVKERFLDSEVVRLKRLAESWNR